MSLIIIRMTVLSEKYREFSQTIALLIASIRKEQGCRRCDVWQDIENENQLLLLEEWDTPADLNRHLNSERFKVLRGAMTLLQEPCEITTCELV